MTTSKSMNEQKKSCLVIGRGAMGILHASFLEKAGFEVALVDRPDAITHFPCGVIHLNDRSECDSSSHTSSADAKDESTVSSVQKSGNDEDDISNNGAHIDIQEQTRRSARVKKLDAPCLTINQAKIFLTYANHDTDHMTEKKIDHTAFTVILVTVKAHQVRTALTPFLSVLQHVSSIILLHNGLQNRSTVSFLLDHGMYEKKGEGIVENGTRTQLFAAMVSCRGSTLLTEEEKPKEYADVARATGHGSAFIFPMAAGSRLDNEKKIEGEKIDSDDRCERNISHERDSSDYFLASLEAVQVAIPDCTVLGCDTGRCEQIIKLSINVSLNGLLARKCLEKWYQHHKRQELQNLSSLTFSVSSATGDKTDLCDLNLTRRIVNREIIPDLPLARSIARLVLQKAYRAEPTNDQIYNAVLNDEAAQRTHDTLHKVPGNVCSTVVDIMNMRMTERDALFETLMNDWKYEVEDLIDEQDIVLCDADSKTICNSSVDGSPFSSVSAASLLPSRKDASIALEEIDCMLKAWNEYVDRTRLNAK